MRRLLLVLLLLIPAPALAQAGFDPFGMARIDDRVGARIPMDARFRDSDGRITTLAKLGRGRPLLLVPVLHECPNICGVTLAGIADAIRGQALRPERDFAVVAFGIDPKEGVAAARGDLARLSAAGRDASAFHALVGPDRAVAAVTGAIGYHYAWDSRINQYAHAAATAVITPDGRLSGWLYGLTPQPAALQRAVTQARAGQSGSWTERLLLICYHYDPETGRWTPAVAKVLKLAALATVLGIAALIWRLQRQRA